MTGRTLTGNGSSFRLSLLDALTDDGHLAHLDSEFGIVNFPVATRQSDERACGCCHLIHAEHLVTGGICRDCA